MTNITTKYCDLNWLKWLDLKMTVKEMDVWLHVVTLQNLNLDLESRLDVMLHRFLFSQAESPEGSKTQAHGSPLKYKMSYCSLAKKVGKSIFKVL